MVIMAGIWINGIEFKGASVVSLTLEADVQKHPVEKGFAVADNIKHESPQFKVTLTLGGSLNGASKITEYNNLKTWKESGLLFTFACELGSYNDMILKSVSPAMERSANTYSCEIMIVQIRQAALVTQTFEIPGIYSPTKPKGTPSTQAPQEKPGSAPASKGNSWFSTLSTWVAGLF